MSLESVLCATVNEAAVTHRPVSTIIHFQRKEKKKYHVSQRYVRKNSIAYSAMELEVTNVFNTLLFFLLLLQLLTCQEFLKRQRFSTLIQAEVGAPPDRHKAMAMVQEARHFSRADFIVSVAKNCNRCRMCHYTASEMSLWRVHSGFH